MRYLESSYELVAKLILKGFLGCLFLYFFLLKKDGAVHQHQKYRAFIMCSFSCEEIFKNPTINIRSIGKFLSYATIMEL